MTVEAERLMEADLRYLVDRTHIVETIIRYFSALDDKDFVELRSTIADTIDVDFSLLSGKPGAMHEADTFVASVSKSLSGGSATQHISANHVVTIIGDRADAAASLYAWHEPPAEGSGIGTLRGSYAIALVRSVEGWRIDKLHMAALWAKPDHQISLS